MSDSSDTHISIPLNGTVHDRGNALKNPIPLEDLPPEIQKFLNNKKAKDKQNRKTIEMLEGMHVLSLIVFINSMSPVIKTDIHTHISRCAGMNDKLDDLIGMGLIKVYQTAHTNTNVVVITDKGREVANMLQEMIDFIDKDMK